MLRIIYCCQHPGARKFPAPDPDSSYKPLLYKREVVAAGITMSADVDISPVMVDTLLYPQIPDYEIIHEI